MPTPSGSSVSYAFVDGEGQPVDASSWVKANIWMAGLPATYIVLNVFSDPARTIKAGLLLGLGLTLALGSLSRVWALVHDARHREASRDWWVAHHTTGRRRCFVGGGLGLVLFGGLIPICLAADASYAAALLVGPTVGSLTTVTIAAEAARLSHQRASRASHGPAPI